MAGPAEIRVVSCSALTIGVRRERAASSSREILQDPGELRCRGWGGK